METRFPSSLCGSLRTTLPALLAASVLAACGGGGGTGGTGTTTPPPGAGGSTVSTGVMTKGSTIVNGVRFEDTTANISIDDTPKTSLALQNGMVVKVAGNVNDDGINGTAQRVKALIEARGTPTSIPAGANPQRIVVLGQTVLVDDQTVYSNVNGFNAITTSTLVEVHGLRGQDDLIRATRIEDRAPQMGNSTLDEIRGVVANRTATTFTIAGQPINFGAAVIVPTGASFQNGSVVEVYCSARPCVLAGVFQASQLKVEDAQDDAFRPASGQRMEAEGLISGFSAGAQNFSVGSTPVTTTGSTRFAGGIATDLANNVKVEAEGSWNGTRLIASKIEFKRSVVRLQGNVTASGPDQFTMNVANHSVTIVTDGLTDGAVPPVGPACVQVRGQRRLPATQPVVTAGEIRVNNCSNGNRPIMQAPVEAESGTNLTLLGFPINVGTVNDNPPFENFDGTPLTQAAFLNAVTPATTNAAGVSVPGTLVKAIFDSGTNAVRQAELED
jgi:Domain of unknown function (DUF5666)